MPPRARALPLGLPDWIGAHVDALSAIGGMKAIVCFLAGELALRSRTRLFGERPFEIALHEAPLGAIDGRASHHHGASNLLIAAADIGGQQDLGSLELAGGMLTCAQHRSELIAFGL